MLILKRRNCDGDGLQNVFFFLFIKIGTCKDFHAWIMQGKKRCLCGVALTHCQWLLTTTWQRICIQPLQDFFTALSSESVLTFVAFFVWGGKLRFFSPKLVFDLQENVNNYGLPQFLREGPKKTYTALSQHYRHLQLANLQTVSMIES